MFSFQSILEENITQLDDSDNVRLRTVQFCGIPDALYMVHDHGSPSLGGCYGNATGGICHDIPRVSVAAAATAHSVDIIAGTIPGGFNEFCVGGVPKAF